MQSFRPFVLAILLVCSVCTVQARETPEEKQTRKVEQFLSTFGGMCPGLLKSQFRKNPEMGEMGPEMVENISGGACGCFVDELRARPASEVAPMLKGNSADMDALMSRCTVRSLKLHVGTMCMDAGNGATAASASQCACVQSRMNATDEDTLTSMVLNDDEQGFEALMGECKTAE